MPLPRDPLAPLLVALALASAACTPNSPGESLIDQAFAPKDPGRFAYVVNSGDDTISSYVVGTFGRLGSNGYFTYNVTPTAPSNIVAHPDREYFFTTNEASGSVSVLQVEPQTGDLTSVGAVSGLGLGSLDIVVHPDGAFVYVVSETSNVLTTLGFDTETGVLSVLGSPLQTPTQTPRFLRVDPRGRFLVVLDSLNGSMTSYNVAGNGNLAVGTTLTVSPGIIGGATVDFGGNNLYVTLSNFDTIVRVAVDSTSSVFPLILQESRPTDSNLDETASPQGVDLHPSGRFVYVLNADADTIFFYAVDLATFELDPIGALPSLEGATDLVFEPEGNQGYLIDPAKNGLVRYAWSFEDGTLEPREEIRARKQPLGMAFLEATERAEPFATELYVVNRASSDVSAYAVNPATGALTAIGAPLPAGTEPVDIAVDRRRRFAFVVSATSRELIPFLIAADGGLETPTTTVPLAGTPTAVTVDPSARFVYVALRDPNAVEAFSLVDDQGLLPLGFPLDVGAEPSDVVVDPTGQWLYVVNSALESAGTSSTVSIFSISPLSGTPTAVSPTATAAGGAVRLALSPNGTRLYTSLNQTDGAIPASISPALGTLSLVPPATPTGAGPLGLTTVPSDRFVYVAARDEAPSGVVQLFDVRASDGALINDEDGSPTPRQTIAAGVAPTAVLVDPKENWLYVLGSASDTVSVLNLATDGLLSAGSEVSTGTEPVAAALVGVIGGAP